MIREKAPATAQVIVVYILDARVAELVVTKVTVCDELIRSIGKTTDPGGGLGPAQLKKRSLSL
jgi:hypothetical protein